ncbi:MAG TPA: polysaccharide deacetylase family protein [Bacteroidia bacterium]|nr:polysaccharide deacetylase family protein [Bacteroidia bacterium]
MAFSLLLILIIGSSSFLNMALSKSSSHIPLLTSDGISINGGTASSNINGTYNQSFLTSRPYLAHAPSDYTLDGNISGAVNNTNNKVVMIGFDDGWKSQITYAKPILDKYGFKASFFVVCNYAELAGYCSITKGWYGYRIPYNGS